VIIQLILEFLTGRSRLTRIYQTSCRMIMMVVTGYFLRIDGEEKIKCISCPKSYH